MNRRCEECEQMYDDSYQYHACPHNEHNPIEAIMKERGERIDSMTIAELISESHATAVEKGWWEKDRPFSEGIALMHSELSEALEEWRKSGMDRMIYYSGGECGEVAVEDSEHIKPEGIAVELADLLIRVCDWCGKHNIPLEAALRAKMAYNKTRSFRHGNKLA